MTLPTAMRVLNVVTSEEATFFEYQISSLERQGIDCTTLSIPGRNWRDDGTVETRSLWDYARIFPRVLRRSFDSYDLIHANSGLTAPLALAQPNLPVVLSLWGTDLFGPYGSVSKLCARRCDAVVVMSDEMAAELDRPCHVIPHGIDMERFAPRSRRTAQAELGWDHDTHHVLFPYPPGMEVKNLPRAKRVVAAANERLDTRIELQTVHGIPHEQIPVYLNASDALLMTSDSEGSPNAVKEALACNLPVISTDVGDVRERLDGVSPSVVCRTDEELTTALVNVLERGVRSNGRETVQHLSVERMGQRLAGVYESVIYDRQP